MLGGVRDKTACIDCPAELDDTEDQREEDSGSDGEFH
jgi:hypothetical protein